MKKKLKLKKSEQKENLEKILDVEPEADDVLEQDEEKKGLSDRVKTGLKIAGGIAGGALLFLGGILIGGRKSGGDEDWDDTDYLDMLESPSTSTTEES